MAAAAATPADPAAAAVDFLEKVRSRSVNLEPAADTALAPQTSADKRREISRRLERLAKDLGNDPLAAGPIRTDRELAGVLVRQTGGLDPARLQVLAIALIRRGDVWLPAPVPGSFENSGIRHTADLRERIAALESWMLREQALDLGKMREQTLERIRRQIESSLPAATLRALDSHGVCERFLSACARRDVAAVLGLMGGLSQQLPDDWEWRLKMTRRALEENDPPRPWRLLAHPDVLRAIIAQDTEENDAMISIACLDPSGGGAGAPTPRPEIVHLELIKSPDGLWRVDPPAEFFQPGSADPESTAEEPDSELPDDFSAKLRAACPAEPQPSARAIHQLTLDALRHGPFPSSVRLMQLEPATDSATAGLVRAAQDWRSLHEPAALRVPIPHGFMENDSAAVAVWQIFSPKQPERLDLRRLHFRKTGSGWLWTPDASHADGEIFGDWLKTEETRLQASWRSEMLTDSVRLTAIPESGAPSEDEARSVVNAWLETTGKGEMPAALRLTARLQTPESDSLLLRNFGYEMTGNARASEKPRITSVRRGALWALVAVRTLIDGKESLPLYPVLRTPAGPRILLEIDLFAGGGRSRDFLNQAALEHLRGTSAPAARELREWLGQATR